MPKTINVRIAPTQRNDRQTLGGMWSQNIFEEATTATSTTIIRILPLTCFKIQILLLLNQQGELVVLRWLYRSSPLEVLSALSPAL